MDGAAMENANPAAVPGADGTAAADTTLPPFKAGSKVYSGERWLPMVLGHWRIAWNVENATYMYLLQKGRSVASLRCEDWFRESQRYAAMLLSAASREDKFVLEALWNAWNPRQVYEPIAVWLQDIKKPTSVATEEQSMQTEVDRAEAEAWLGEYEKNSGQKTAEVDEITTKPRKRTMAQVRNEDLDLWCRAFRPLFWKKDGKTHIECTSKLWKESANNRTYLQQLIAHQHAEKIGRMASQPAGLLMEHAMRFGAYGDALNCNQPTINGCGFGDKRMKLDELAYERNTMHAVSSMASRLGKAFENVVYMPLGNDMDVAHDLEYAGMMEPVSKEAGKFDMPMENPAVSEEAKANMKQVFEQCVETVGMCERVYTMVLCYKNAVETEDHGQAKFWKKQLGIHLPDQLPAA